MNERDLQIEALISEFQNSDLREIHVRTDEFELYLSKEAGSRIDMQRAAPVSASKPQAPTGIPAAATSSAAPAGVGAAVPDGTIAVPAPYLGTFYRAPKPGAPSYVEVGSRVSAESELCLVEVMKLFTSVRAGIAGTIEAILASDGQMVQAGQPLFAVRPD